MNRQKRVRGGSAARQQQKALSSTVLGKVQALNRLGNQLQAGGRPREAVAFFEKALALAPGLAAIWGNLGSAWMLCNQPAKAVPAYRRALALAGNDDAIRVRLVLALLAQLDRGHDSEEALPQARTLLAQIRRPSADATIHALVLLARARILAGFDNDHAGAQRVVAELLVLEPDWVPALLTAASIAAALSQPGQATGFLRHACRADPRDTELLGRYIYGMQRDPQAKLADLYRATLGFGKRLHAKSPEGAGGGEASSAAASAQVLREDQGSGSGAQPPLARARTDSSAVPSDPDRSLVLGFVSGDFRRHPMGYLVEGLFRCLSRDRVRVIGYSNHPGQDERTALLRGLMDGWRTIHDLDTARVRTQVQADRVDILIDLSGMTGHHRLDLFATRAAPLQLSWLGFHSGTGLDTMDAHLADAETSHGLQAYFRERLVDLPWAFNQPAGSFPDVTALLARAPCERNGYVTFGSLNNPSKCNDAVFDLWADILRRVPDARLVQRFGTFADPSVVAAFRARLVTRGVAEERINCLPGLPQQEALAWLAESVDVGLDPFPFGSHTTGLQSLAVGVPVVSMYGEQIVGRICAVFHQRLGLTEFVVRNPAEYVERAVAITRSPERLAQLRREARTRTLASPLTDEKAFAEIFERVVRGLWRERVSGEGRQKAD